LPSVRSTSRAIAALVVGMLGALIAPGAAYAIDEFALPTSNSQPSGIAVGPDGALWFTEEGLAQGATKQKIGRITTSGIVTEFDVPTEGSMPSKIITGPDGLVWFTEHGGDKIGKFDPPTSAFTEYPPGGFATGSQPDGIIVGPNGALWFTEYGNNAIGQITTSGTITEYPLAGNPHPGDIEVGPDGRVWFVEESDRIGAINPDTGVVSEYPSTGFPTGTEPSGIAASGATLWFTELGANKIGQMSTTGSLLNEFPTGSGPSGIVLGPDGALWFTEINANKIGRLTTGGSLTEFPIPTPSSEPSDIVVGPDGSLWFTERVGNKIGRIAAGTGGGPPPPPPPPPPITQRVIASVVSLGVSPSKFRAAPSGASISASVGATVRYNLAAAATTRFTVERQTAGRKKGKKCVPQTRRNRRAKKCKRYVKVKGSFTHAGKSGANSFRFTGRIANKKLRPGRYQLVASVPTSSAKPKRAAFKIVRR
jgi:virginiamycin B lyase